MGFFTPRRCTDSCKCKPGCACEIRLTFEPRIGSLHCQFDVDIQLFKVCDGAETELDPADYDIRARFESSADGVIWSTEIESSANTVKFVLLDFRGASGYYYRLTAWEGAGSTGEDCAGGIDEEVVTYFEDRICDPESGDCCTVTTISVSVGSTGSGCCSPGGSFALDSGLYRLLNDTTTGPYAELDAAPCIWSKVVFDDWDCNGTGACQTIESSTHFTYYYKDFAVFVYLNASNLFIVVTQGIFQVRVAKFPLPYECLVSFVANSASAASYIRDPCTSGVATLDGKLTDSLSDCELPDTISVTIT